ncbi:cysteine--tRNA ligase [Canibacter sp. lx-45]|uniref:cysteine--tRNA ligase n=1 Tax=Canibacter zhuwentaonis TaxID=2837491 RepID=UPI001BDC9F94|nr:cysteine--tRNA ligase [Canibacter zhuwentaonis]MBT1034891.1 cysteine--tRNA ligase [Canibacter zhuwentaonis]
MQQKIYDSYLAQTVAFEPREAEQVGMYVCGPTVQSPPHIGHLRSALVYDQMCRWFLATGHRVTLIRNVTDIDDKILANAAGTTARWWQLAARVERDFSECYSAIGVAAGAAEPRATGHIPEIDALIGRLIERGYAYQSDDGSVYFDTVAWSGYGELTRQSLDAVETGAETVPGKRHATDFALWKAHREGEPDDAQWQITNGAAGRPGWHIECSAMATRYLGSAFDIHGGGRDLRFPHHENEHAQSRAAGDEFAKYWVHNGLINVGDQKMSKSLGNSLFAADLLAQTDPLAVRYMLGAAHYRSTLTFSLKAMEEASAAVTRIVQALSRAAILLGAEMPPVHESCEGLAKLVPEAFALAMCDDFALPQALSCVHESVRALNTALQQEDVSAARGHCANLVAMLGVLHLDPRHAQWHNKNAAVASAKSHIALDTLVSELIAKRNLAREQKNWAASDEIRDFLSTAGITLTDTGQGTNWSL